MGGEQLTISGDASSLTGTTAPVAGGELVIEFEL